MFSEKRVAAPESLDDAAVLLDARIPIFRIAGQTMDSQNNEGEQRHNNPLQGLFQIAVFSLLTDKEMESKVSFIERPHIFAIGSRLHIGKHLLEITEIRLLLGDDTSRQTLNDLPEFVDLPEIFIGQKGYACASSTSLLHESFRGKYVQSFSHRCLCSAQFLGPLSLNDPFAGIKPATDYLFA
jgi:hypothetical protein